MGLREHDIGPIQVSIMTINDKLDALNLIYEIYAEFSKDLTVACTRKCSVCCTQDVTMTTVEGYHILSHLISTGKWDLIQNVRDTEHSKRFRPAFSTNEFAYLCLRGEDPHDECAGFSSGRCPFLAADECLIYDSRPFGCRGFYSKVKCETTSSAVVDPLLVSVNSVFLQSLEHIDAGGFFGNMIDVLLFLEHEKNRLDYAAQTNTETPAGLVPNRPMPAFMVPPKHRQSILPILTRLRHLNRA